jgi:hypothetical protein
MSGDKSSEKQGLSPLALWATIGIICFGVGLPLYLVKQDQDAKERARLELEAKCSAYEDELTALIKRFYRLSAKGSSLEEQAGRGSIQFSASLPGIHDNLISMDEVSDKMKSVDDAFKQECGEERSKAWFGANFDRLRQEVEAE